MSFAPIFLKKFIVRAIVHRFPVYFMFTIKGLIYIK